MSETKTGGTGERDSDVGEPKKVKMKAIFTEGVLRPDKKLSLNEGEEVEIEITRRKERALFKPKERKATRRKLKFDWEGGLSEMKSRFTSVRLQHKALEWR